MNKVMFSRAKLVENYFKPSIANFGRSLFGGYCPTYVPDFVLHGAPNDEKLRQNLVSDLAHAVQVNTPPTGPQAAPAKPLLLIDTVI